MKFSKVTYCRPVKFFLLSILKAVIDSISNRIFTAIIESTWCEQTLCYPYLLWYLMCVLVCHWLPDQTIEPSNLVHTRCTPHEHIFWRPYNMVKIISLDELFDKRSDIVTPYISILYDFILSLVSLKRWSNIFAYNTAGRLKLRCF